MDQDYTLARRKLTKSGITTILKPCQADGIIQLRVGAVPNGYPSADKILETAISITESH